MSERVRAFYHRHSHARQYQECAELAAAMLPMKPLPCPSRRGPKWMPIHGASLRP